MTDYEKFLESKAATAISSGFEIGKDELNPMLFEYQRDIVRWALRKGRAAIFADCGMGKGQPYGSKVLTTQGWVEIQNLKVGDMVYASDGKPYAIKGVFPKGELPTYKFHFSDGSSGFFTGSTKASP